MSHSYFAARSVATDGYVGAACVDALFSGKKDAQSGGLEPRGPGCAIGLLRADCVVGHRSGGVWLPGADDRKRGPKTAERSGTACMPHSGRWRTVENRRYREMRCVEEARRAMREGTECVRALE
ncbi:hypothetical protein NDU88_010104 [Pleurodeles waltl]|uniref:Uncharacterized protein n=1 Tax=Pleurodeles waltl TaxID=8319 RepID=A0AAV7QX95_PLEWA|nr:hypothetical protein NDU88_010104 [Pleurodeles waltl]